MRKKLTYWGKNRKQGTGKFSSHLLLHQFPAPVLKGIDKERIEINRRYLEKEQEKKEVIKPWNCKDWKFVRKHLFKGAVSNLELLIKCCFFLKQRYINCQNWNGMCWGVGELI